VSGHADENEEHHCKGGSGKNRKREEISEEAKKVRKPLASAT
jgi:hypothetical protein